MRQSRVDDAACRLLRATARRCYLVVIAETIEPTTMVAIWNWAARSLMLWRLAIHSKSVQTAQRSPWSSCVSSSLTGQSSPAFGLDVMNWVPSGGVVKTDKDGGGRLSA